MTALDDALAWMEGDGLALFWSGFLVFVRIGAVMALLPLFGDQRVPVRLRLALALAFTMVVAPAVNAPMTPGPAMILAEAVVGLLIGAGFRLMVAALQIAGTIAAQATSLAQLFAGAEIEPMPAISNLLTMGALALGFALSLHLEVAALLIRSYDLLPQGRLPDVTDSAAWGIAQVARAFEGGLKLAMPFVIAGLLYNVALGAINRAMPTLMVALIGAPALTLGGLVLLALTAPMMLAVWLQGFRAWMADPFVLP